MASPKYLAVTEALKAMSKAYTVASQEVMKGLTDMVKEDHDGTLTVDDDSLSDMLNNAFYRLSEAVFKSLEASEVKRIG